jgi:hypothetical protein
MMSEKIKFDEYIVTSIEEQEYIRKDFRKSIAIILLSIFTSLMFTYVLYII